LMTVVMLPELSEIESWRSNKSQQIVHTVLKYTLLSDVALLATV
jgi:hypothetical protein